jgi:hypothetical protein
MTQEKTPENQGPNLVQPDQVIPMDAAALVEFNDALRDQVKTLKRANQALRQSAHEEISKLQKINADLIDKYETITEA